jgi:hypothetical protein
MYLEDGSDVYEIVHTAAVAQLLAACTLLATTEWATLNLHLVFVSRCGSFFNVVGSRNDEDLPL